VLSGIQAGKSICLKNGLTEAKKKKGIKPVAIYIHIFFWGSNWGGNRGGKWKEVVFGGEGLVKIRNYLEGTCLAHSRTSCCTLLCCPSPCILYSWLARCSFWTPVPSLLLYATCPQEDLVWFYCAFHFFFLELNVWLQHLWICRSKHTKSNYRAS
jgi:hypothetical protein